MIKEYYSEEEFLPEIKLAVSKYEMYIAGAGSYGKLIGEYLIREEIPFKGFLDKNEDIEQLLGKRVISYRKLNKENVYIIISSNSLMIDLIQELLEIGVTLNQMCIPKVKSYMLMNLPSIHMNRLLSFRGKYHNKRCFIVGNGPSLSIEDLDRIKGEYSFGCNAIFGTFSHTQWRPDFYCTLDSMIISHLYDGLHGKALDWQCSKFSLINEMSNYDKDHEFILCNAVDDIESIDQLPVFSSECDRYICTVGTVTYFMLQLAVYMGFGEIILLGIDFNFAVEKHADGSIKKNDVKNHMDLIEEAMPTKESNILKKKINVLGYDCVGYIDKQYAGYKAAKKYADAHGIKIINASRKTKLDVFEKVNLENYL